MSGKLDGVIKDVIKGHIRSIVNEEIQKKDYRKLITDRVEKIMIDGINDGMSVEEFAMVYKPKRG